MADLLQRGWVDLAGNDYFLIQKGKAVRQAAEANTDRYFFRPGSGLSAQEIATHEEQIQLFKEALK